MISHPRKTRDHLAFAAAVCVTITLIAGCGNAQRHDRSTTQPGELSASSLTGSSWATDGRVPQPAERTPFRPAGANRAVAPPAPGLDDLEWMVGCWSSYDPATQIWVEECWSTIVGDMMLGANRTVRGQRVAAFEQIRIEVHNDGVWYFASPGGKPATAFMRVTPTSIDRRGAQHVAVFENLQHDFPQRIIYRSDGRTHLEATVEGFLGEEELPDGTTRPREVRHSWRWER